MRSFAAIAAVLSLAVSPALRAQTKPMQVRGDLPKDSKFLTPSAKLTDADRMKFETLAGLAKLQYVSRTKAQGYPVHFDLLAANEALDKVIVFGSQRVDKKTANALYAEEDVIFAPVTIGDHPMTLLFIGFKTDEVQNLIGRFKQEYAANRKTGGRALAAADAAVGGSGAAPSTEQLAKTAEEGLQFAYGLGISSRECIFGVIDGFNAVTWDPVRDAGKSVWTFATDTRRWITGSKEEVKSLFHNIRHFDEFASKTWADWGKKSAYEKSRFYCSFYGGGAGGAATARIVGKLGTMAAGTGKAAAAAGKPAQATSAGASSTAQDAAEFTAKNLYRNGKAPQDLARVAKDIVEPNSPYIGKTWWEFPPEGSYNYPYIADKKSLSALKSMTGNPIPDPKTLKDWNWKGAAQSLKDYTGAAERVEKAVKGSTDIAIDGQPYALVKGERYNSLKLATASDYKPAPPTSNNMLTGQKIIKDGGRFRSVTSPAIEYQGNGMTGYSTKVPNIQGSPVKVIAGDKVIEGTYLSSGGPGVPRGASYLQLGPSWESQIKFHFIQSGNQTLVVPAEGAEVFADY
jgi:hypothetical protein